MSLFSQAAHNLVSWFSGKIDFNTLESIELNDLHKATAKLPPAVQDGVNAMVTRMASNASAVGQIAGQALAPLLNETADQQATQVQAMLTAIGVNPVAGTPLSALEHAALSTVITGMHATLDRVGIAIAHIGVTPASPEGQPASDAQPAS